MAGDRRHERGGTLVAAMIILGSLTLLGLVVVQRVLVDTRTTAAQRSAEVALHIAEAGLRHGMEVVGAALTNNTPLTTILAETQIPTSACNANCPLNGWRRAIPGVDRVNYGPGYYLVAVGDDEFDETTDPNGTILIRAMGVSFGGKYDGAASIGSTRLLEVTVQFDPGA